MGLREFFVFFASEFGPTLRNKVGYFFCQFRFEAFCVVNVFLKECTGENVLFFAVVGEGVVF
jgi:hypothetical protein